MTTQTTEVSDTWRSRSIVGSASTTIVVSTAVMSTPVITTTMARPVWEAGPDCWPADTACTLLLIKATSLPTAPAALRHNSAYDLRDIRSQPVA
jgi:hypothetical protein